MDLTTVFIVLQTGWDMFLLVVFSTIIALGIGITLVYFQD